ncbi:MAG TPA: lysophospholipid acyltransferase family protein [Acidobacteriota bacterium]|nr:lysophospholipid acyltransferase family protein [Acidobacteriota bacterium]
MIASAFLAVFYAVLILLLAPVILFCMLIGVRDPLIAVGLWAMRVSRRVLRIKVEAEGLDRIAPGTPYIFMPNHASFMDGPLVMMLIPGTPRVILKRSILRIPFLGLGMRHVGFVPVDRKGTEGGKRSIARAAALIRERGYSFLIFPEGTRTRDGKLQPFRRGGFFLALASGAAIVPVTIRGTFELMPKGQWHARRGRVRVAFHEPVPVAGVTSENMAPLMEAVRREVASGMEA